MRDFVKKVILVVAIFGAGVAFEYVRAQSRAALGDARFEHIGISVTNVDKVVGKFTEQLQARHTPVHDIKASWAYPEGTEYDRNVYVHTSEIQMNGIEIHLMQPVGGRSPWGDHREKYGEYALEHIAFASKDVKGVADQLVAKGGKILIGRPEDGFCYIQMPDLPFIIELYRDRR